MRGLWGRRTRAIRLLGQLALTATLCLLASCFALFRDLEDLRLGGLTIRVAEDIPMNLTPPAEMTVAGYDVSGTGPDGATFFTSFTGASITQRGLAFGEWTITVEGRNPENTIVTRGAADVQVATGTAQVVDIIMYPVAGPGTLTLAVTWVPTSVDVPSVLSQLVPSQGPPTDLAFTMPSPGEAGYSNGTIQSGYYTLIVRLLDNGQLVMGAVDVVRIVAGETTSGSIDFTDVNRGTGTVSVSITLQMNEPVQVTMNGQTTELGSGHLMTVSASIPPGLGNATYGWSVNGVSAGGDSSITLNGTAHPLSPGPYRLDVCAFVSNGSRGGSTTCSFTVFTVRQVTLEWDPNTETNLAGYKMHVGTSSGAYGDPIDVGLATTCTVPNLLAKHTYYFTVTACNTAGMESGKSNEVSYTAP
ncbi:MAG: fibronectin type III domain-containing protein [Spirochaetes bacterium]|nr:fibronectin type III domain-containing protein [Spirochaetota bacterium]